MGERVECPCGRDRRYCAEHSGSALCPCGKRKNGCEEHGGGIYQCTVPGCAMEGLLFSSSKALKQHTANMHGESGVHQRNVPGCALEGVLFSSSTALQLHTARA